MPGFSLVKAGRTLSSAANRTRYGNDLVQFIAYFIHFIIDLIELLPCESRSPEYLEVIKCFPSHGRIFLGKNHPKIPSQKLKPIFDFKTFINKFDWNS